MVEFNESESPNKIGQSSSNDKVDLSKENEQTMVNVDKDIDLDSNQTNKRNDVRLNTDSQHAKEIQNDFIQTQNSQDGKKNEWLWREKGKEKCSNSSALGYLKKRKKK